MASDDIREKSESLVEIVKGIDTKRIVFPEFQRDFVWDIDKTLDLFDSLVRNIFIGSIIYGIPSDEIHVREIDNRERKRKGKKRKALAVTPLKLDGIDPPHLVLDGQQRLTSIYRALKGTDEIWFTVKSPDEINDGFASKEVWDSESSQLMGERNPSLEEYLHIFSKNDAEDRLSIKLSDVYKAHENPRVFRDSIHDFFTESEYYKNVLANCSDEIIKANFEIYRDVFDNLLYLIKGSERDHVVSYFLLNMSNEKFALFFERSNSKGVHLSFIDILVAKLYISFNLREKINAYNRDLPKNRPALKQETVIRTVAYLTSKAVDEDRIYVDKNYILSKLKPENFNEYWDLVLELYDKTVTYLEDNHYIIDLSWIPYDNMLIPLMMFLDNLPSKDFSQMTADQKRFVDYWYWTSGFTKHYSGSSNETIIQDARMLTRIAQNKKVDEKFFRKLNPKKTLESPDDLIDEVAKFNSPIYRSLMNFLSYRSTGVTSWRNGDKFSSGLDSHHIFPKEYLGDDEDVESIVNRILIPKIDNIKIGKKAPSVYLTEFLEGNENLAQILETEAFIPKSLITGDFDDKDKYYEFLELRAKMLYDVLEKELFSKTSEIQEKFVLSS